MATTSTLDSASTISGIEKILGESARYLLEHRCKTIPKDQLHLPGPDFIGRVWLGSDRKAPVLRNLQALFDRGRLQRGRIHTRCARFGVPKIRPQDSIHIENQP